MKPANLATFILGALTVIVWALRAADRYYPPCGGIERELEGYIIRPRGDCA